MIFRYKLRFESAMEACYWEKEVVQKENTTRTFKMPDGNTICVTVQEKKDDDTLDYYECPSCGNIYELNHCPECDEETCVEVVTDG